MQATPLGPRIVVVGLGNPGKAYSTHRHNLGFMVADRLAQEERALWRKVRENAVVCEIRIDGVLATLVQPQTYMNLSGLAVAPILRKRNVDPSAMIVVHDDLDLAPGKVRIKSGGGDGGHRGVRSIAQTAQSRDFIRVRMGIGRPPGGVDPEEFVLSGITKEEAEGLADHVSRGVQAVRLIATLGLDSARTLIHAGKLTAPPAASGS